MRLKLLVRKPVSTRDADAGMRNDKPQRVPHCSLGDSQLNMLVERDLAECLVARIRVPS
jgi:hypothetical protein